MARKRDKPAPLPVPTKDQKTIKRLLGSLGLLRALLRQWVAKCAAGHVPSALEKREIKDLLAQVASAKLEIGKCRSNEARMQTSWAGASSVPVAQPTGQNSGGVGVYGIGPRTKFWKG